MSNLKIVFDVGHVSLSAKWVLAFCTTPLPIYNALQVYKLLSSEKFLLLSQIKHTK